MPAECKPLGSRGKKEKAAIGDAEEQAAIKAANDDSEGGEKVLATVQLADIAPNQWHNLKLRFEGSTITVLVDGKRVLQASDTLYRHGMAGLMTGKNMDKGLSTAYFDNLLIASPNAAAAPKASSAAAGQRPIYRGAELQTP